MAKKDDKKAKKDKKTKAKSPKAKSAKVKAIKAAPSKSKADVKRGGKGKKALHKPVANVALEVSRLAPLRFPDLPQIAGVEFATAAAGIKYEGRDDLMLVRLAPGTALAGAFTQSSTRAACVDDAQRKLKGSKLSRSGAAIVVNSGNANAFTGARGTESVVAITEAVAKALSVPVDRVLSSSTGVIGEALEPKPILDALPDLVKALAPDAAAHAAHAIMTTDTFAKGACAEIVTDTGPIRIAGIAKGSGMIAPDMATMLVYLFTDARISPALLQRVVTGQLDHSFNAITVDSDTSTSDAVIVAATGQSKAPVIRDLRTKHARDFAAALGDVMRDLAKQVVSDGEGATKFIEVQVTGATNDSDARKVATAIANSPLVKTAVAGADANWGRVVMAVGKSGAKADRDLLTIRFGDMIVAEKGQRAADYHEGLASAYMKRDHLVIGVDLGLGKGARTMWTCDLTHGYIAINADYRS